MNTDRSQATVSENKQSKMPACGFVPTGEENAKNGLRYIKGTATGGASGFGLLRGVFTPRVNVELIREIGLKKAIILQTIAIMAESYGAVKLGDGNWWVRSTLRELVDSRLPFMTVVTLCKYVVELEKDGILVSCQPGGAADRAKYYRVNWSMVQE